MLRVRSILSGRPVAELAFAEGQRLRADEIYLIRQGSGELIGHWPPEASISAQEHRVSGILAAINEIATEAFEAERATLRRIDLGSSLVYLRASPATLLVAKCSGVAPPSVESIIDAHFLATIERLRTLLNGSIEGPASQRAVKNLLEGFAVGLEGALAELQAKLVGRRKVASPSMVVVGSIALALASWAAWAAYTGYETGKVRASAEAALAQDSALRGYPVRAAVAPRGRAVALTGLVPTPEAGRSALNRLREALPAARVTDATNSLPGGLTEAQADIKTLQSALTQLTAESTRSNTALQQRLDDAADAARALGHRRLARRPQSARHPGRARQRRYAGSPRQAAGCADAGGDGAALRHRGGARRDRPRRGTDCARTARAVGARACDLLHQGYRLPRAADGRRHARRARAAS